MKINSHTMIGDLKPGRPFVVNDKHYMKTQCGYDSDDNCVNCVNLVSGELHGFIDEVVVIPIRVELKYVK